MEEIWKDIPNYEGKYQASNLGRIRNKKGKVLKTFNKHGKKKYNPENDYQKIRLSKENKSKSYLVHRLIIETFIPNLENKPQVNHINGIKNDNRVKNLEYCTNQENRIHYIKYLKGEKNGNNK